MSDILGEVVSEDLTVQSLFLDVGREFKPSAKPEVRRVVTPIPPYIFVYFALAIDLAILIGVGVAIYAGTSGATLPSWHNLIPLSAVALCTSWLFILAKAHRVEFIGSYRRYFKKLARAWVVVAVGSVTLDAFFQPSVAPGFPHALNFEIPALLAWLTLWGLALASARYALAALFRYCVKQQHVAHDVVIFGATDLAAQFARRVAADQLGIRPRAIFDDAIGNTTPHEIASIPVCGGIDELVEFNKRNKIADVVIALPLEEEDRINGLVRQLGMHPLKISLLPGPLAAVIAPGGHTGFGELPGIHVVPLVHLPIDFYGRLIKGAFDRSVALFALLFFAPVMLACVIGIKLTSPGTIFYRQRRIGYRNAEFMVFKFRSMHQSACNTGKLTVRDDPRVFAFGLIMRKFSLDELPQLFNVLRGDMSLVGPRPHMPEARAGNQLYAEAVPEYPARHRVKPGITGWAQVSGWRGPTEKLYQIEQRVAHDLHYIENWSLWLDVKILVRTCLVGFFGQNAY